MSSLTSLSVNKNSTRFAPKVKARPSRPPAQKPPTAPTAPTAPTEATTTSTGTGTTSQSSTVPIQEKAAKKEPIIPTPLPPQVHQPPPPIIVSESRPSAVQSSAIPSIATASPRNSSQTSSSSAKSRLPTVSSSSKTPTVVKNKSDNASRPGVVRRQPMVVSATSLNLNGDSAAPNSAPPIIKTNGDIKQEIPETCALSNKNKNSQSFSELNLEAIDSLVERRTSRAKAIAVQKGKQTTKPKATRPKLKTSSSQPKISLSFPAENTDQERNTAASTSQSTSRATRNGGNTADKKTLLDTNDMGESDSEFGLDPESDIDNANDSDTANDVNDGNSKSKGKGKGKAKANPNAKAKTKTKTKTKEPGQPSSREIAREKAKEKAKEKAAQKAIEKAEKLKAKEAKEAGKSKKKAKGKGAPISIGVPSNNADSHTNGDTKQVKKDKRRREEINPDDLQTLDDIRTDPANPDFLDRPISHFTRDSHTGIVSKAFKEFEQHRLAKIRKLEERKNLTGAALEEADRKDREEEERKKKMDEAKKAAQQKKISDGPVLEETSNAPQVRLVNGKIVLDTDSLVIDRGAEVEQNDYGSMEVVEENSMSRKVNSQTYGKKTTSQRWTVQETELFFDALAQFGTDFQMMSTLLPGRTRSNVRLKFNREERLNPKKITDYLIRKRKPMDLEKYKAALGEEFDEVPEDFHSIKLS
ncbi:hypothetical protein J3Q64DRAFT_1230366 [Phycomyces blakesleeanus]|uniref:Myb-like domain-containing protein n=1 Tax=Phycomyces blakesleeanus TaxID=4837 RepID=A0ABR3BA91_PHYBL